MLILFDQNHNKIYGLNSYENLEITYEISGDSKLDFSIPLYLHESSLIKEEGYLQTEEHEYVIKSIKKSTDVMQIQAELNLEDIEGKAIEQFSSKEQTADSCARLAIAGTGWTIGKCTVSKKRTIRKEKTTALEVLRQISKTYRCYVVYNSLDKIIDILDDIGEDRGCYFTTELNLRRLEIDSDSNNFYTRIIPIGKDKLKISSVNNGKEYLENYQYSNKTKTLIWEDQRYTDINSLKEDALKKLNELSVPYRAYKVEIIDVSNLSNEYNFLDYHIGDIVYILDPEKEIGEKQRIVKIVKYPDEPDRNTCEIANSVLKFEDIQKELQETTEVVENITTDSGLVDGNKIENLNIDVDTIQTNVIKAVKGEFGEIIANKANIDDLNVTNAKIEKLSTTFATIEQLEASNAKVKVLEANTASIEYVLAGNITAKNIATGAITAGSGIIAQGAIGDGQISSLSANKIQSGTVDTSLVTISGPNGRFRITGNKLQILDSDKDEKLYERIMLGVDEDNNSSLILRGKDGKATLINQEGLTDEGFTEGYGKVRDNSLDAKKFDKNSIVREVNGATENIKGTKVQIGDRTLDVELSTQQNTITAQGNELVTQKSQIQAMDNRINLKIDMQKYNKDMEGVNTSLNKNTTELGLLKDQINLKVSGTEVDKKISEIQIGGRNLVKNSSGNLGSNSFWSDNTKYSSGGYNGNAAIFFQRIGAEEGAPRFIVTNALEPLPKVSKDEEYSLGAMIFVSSEIKMDVESELFLRCSNDTKFIDFCKITIPVDVPRDRWIYMTSQSKINADYNKSVLLHGALGLNGKVYISQVMLVRGNNVPSWAPAPEDLEYAVNQYTEGKITTVNQRINSTQSEVNILKNQVNLKVSSEEVDTKINDLQIGGMNYYIDTDKCLVKTNHNGDHAYMTLGTMSLDSANSLRGKKVTVSVDIEIRNGKRVTGKYNRIGQETEITWKDGTKSYYGAWWSVSDGENVKKRIKSTFVFADKEIIKVRDNSIYIQCAGDYLAVGRPKLEIGDKFTDWSPAPEDIYGEINKVETNTNNSLSEIKLEQGKIFSTVSQLQTSKADKDQLKSYATKSELTQTEDSITAKFNSIGGYNLLKNTALKNDKAFHNPAVGVTVDTSKKNGECFSWKNEQKGHTADQWRGENPVPVEVVAGKTYTASVEVFIPSNHGLDQNIYLEIQWWDSTNKRIKTAGAVADKSRLNMWQTLTVNMEAPANSVKGNARTWVQRNGLVWTSKLMFQEGAVSTGWTPHPSESYEGVTSIDSEGITVTHTKVGTYSTLNADGFRIYNSQNEVIGSLAEKSGLTELTVDTVTANNIYTIQKGDVTWYINGSAGDDFNAGTKEKPLKSVSEALRRTPKILEGHVYLYCYGEIKEDVKIENYFGRHAIFVDLDRSTVLKGHIKVYGCTCVVSLDGHRTNWADTGGALIQNGVKDTSAVEVAGSPDVRVKNLRILNNGGNGVYAINGSCVTVDLCDINGCTTYPWAFAITATDRSRVVIQNCRGSNNRASMSALDGGIIQISSSDSNYTVGVPSPHPRDGKVWVDGGGIFLHGGGHYEGYESNFVTTPKPPVSIHENYWKATSTKSWRDNWGWRSDNNYIYQGSWGQGNHRGFMYFNSADIRSKLSGANIQAVQLRLRRRNAGGSSAGENIHLYGHGYTSQGGSDLGKDYGYIGSLAWGEQKWLSLPMQVANDLKSGAIQGLVIANGSYVICEAEAELWVRYEK
ncbi:phage tail spike protein [Clostridium hydrogeniformans]|uniref:phage tail spike protein n=1 Tax=Clostridium hydrogeniformans TaxID=349933 RepID=UPI00069141FC|nr:phage tail spike protein [Clostridium hydrogeniformans]